MIFAAGLGSRMGKLVTTRPKPLIPVAGKPLIDHAIALARDADIAPIVANLHYQHETLARHLTKQGISQSLELPDLLDTGGGLRNALPLLGDGPVFTLNSDAAWLGPNPLSLLVNAWDATRMDGLMMLIAPENTLGHAGKGDFSLDENGALSRGGQWVYSGAQIIKTAALHTIHERAFSLNKLWNTMLEGRRLYGTTYPGSWCDVGTPQGVDLAETMLRSADV